MYCYLLLQGKIFIIEGQINAFGYETMDWGKFMLTWFVCLIKARYSTISPSNITL